jgi:hypothetical protein
VAESTTWGEVPRELLGEELIAVAGRRQPGPALCLLYRARLQAVNEIVRHRARYLSCLV